MWCRGIQGRLSAYIDGELPAVDRRSVEAHLRGCERCRTEQSRLRQLVQVAAQIPEEELPADLHSRIMMRLAYADAAPAPARRTAPPVGPWMCTAVTGAAAALAFGVLRPDPGTSLQRGPERGPAPVTAAMPRPAVAPPGVAPPATTGQRQQVAEAPPAPASEHEARADAAPKTHAAVPPPVTRKIVEARLPSAPRLQPLRSAPFAAKPVTDLRTAEPIAPAVLVEPGDVAVMPGSPVVNSTGSMIESVAMPGTGTDSITRMAGMMGDGQGMPQEDEGVKALRKFLEDRNHTVPQPPPLESKGDRRPKKSGA